VVFTNSVRRMESFSVRALVRFVKMRPPATATRRTAAATPAQSQVLELGAADAEEDETELAAEEETAEADEI
jgi:hypothetical protein